MVLHAVADGICGAAGLGDIGDYFPPGAAKSKGIKSKKILATILADIKGKFIIDNIDITIMAEKPRLKNHKAKMVMALKKILISSLPTGRNIYGCIINRPCPLDWGLGILQKNQISKSP